MGIDTASATFLCAARSLDVDFSRTATIGRQTFYPDATQLARIFSVHGVPGDVKAFVREHRFAEPFFRALGARSVESIDYSAYEGATIVHDLNTPIDGTLGEKFSIVHDGGTLEHVFNVPQALKSCMEMVEVGGHFTQVTVANNFLGHGFWQFSPELVFRVFSRVNGFEIVAVLLHEVVAGGAWYLVSDPDAVQSRVELCNARPTYILTIARRVARAEIFVTPPQQSDYVAQWNKGGENGRGAAEGAPATNGPRWHRHVGAVHALAKQLRSRWRRRRTRRSDRAFQRPYFRRIDERALMRGRLERPGTERPRR